MAIGGESTARSEVDHASLATTLKLFGQVIQLERVVAPLADLDTAWLAVEGQNRIG